MSDFADARRLLGLLATFAMLATAGCGGGGDKDRRTQVKEFLDHVNAVQEQSAPQFDRANRTYLAFSKGSLAPARAKRELAAAERSMREARDQIASAKAPHDAAELKRRLVLLFDADASMAHEATLLASFLPAQQAATKPLRGLSARLTKDLRSGKTPAAQESALRRYGDGVAGVIGKLQPLEPPPLLLERHHDQVVHLEAVHALSQRLVSALKAQDSRQVARLLLRFRKLSATPSGSVSAGAVRSYQRRYTNVLHAEQKVERERRRLEKVLG